MKQRFSNSFLQLSRGDTVVGSIDRSIELCFRHMHGGRVNTDI
jgi:hypothetical protein